MNNPQIPYDYIDRLKAGDADILKELYSSNYPKVEQYVLQNKGTTEHAKDVYQEAFLAVWQKIRTGTFTENRPGSINGFLYTVAKNKWLDYLRSSHFKKTLELTENNMTEPIHDQYYDAQKDREEMKLKRTMESFRNLNTECKEILIKFYYQKMSLREIAVLINIDEASARNKKYRCMQKLRELTFSAIK